MGPLCFFQDATQDVINFRTATYEARLMDRRDLLFRARALVMNIAVQRVPWPLPCSPCSPCSSPPRNRR